MRDAGTRKFDLILEKLYDVSFVPNLDFGGTTQGDTAAMMMYASCLMPLVIPLKDISQVTQIFYADDGLGGGTLASVNQWWDKIKLKGPEYGYLPEDEAKTLFPDVNITSEGQRYLGSYIGTKEGQDKFVKKEVDKWASEKTSLAEIANSEPQLTYTAYTVGYRNGGPI